MPCAASWAASPGSRPRAPVPGIGSRRSCRRSATAHTCRSGRAGRDRPDAPAPRRGGSTGPRPSGPTVATDTARREPLLAPSDRLRLEGHLGVCRAQRQKAQPHAQARHRGLHPAVGDRGDEAAAQPRHRAGDGREARQVDVDLERSGRQCREVARGLHELFDVMPHFVEHRVGQRRGRERPRAISAFSQASQWCQLGPEDPLGNPESGQRIRHDGDGVLVLPGPVPRSDTPRRTRRKTLDRVAQEAIEQVEVDRPDLALQGVRQERREVALLMEHRRGPLRGSPRRSSRGGRG